ncbi:hypothetical protein BX616_004735 [Lobosporangium transversale]|uniref:DUF1294 domain-containing protein n=1 Tax=Lobosporangium transversale TaxID=64571 RepID=A0A1Y2GZX1_9FUNG|nr:hypothetical protein BCR41DRAFT_418851 [Lobosporangium transversale]KAF9916052.1 hypothetical protein BX616_004735 [Lobosporangium transversale]ORZ27860.1 hypothetical protein BCR41DRAFT_418851 [Lobosporangium transversale]|eukprot:XP_021885563.1 hypothetical protein BCR41DRAFT_418851 [Lobosporangium transversale]
MTKAAKPLKPSKAAKQQRRQAVNSNPFAGSSLFEKSEQYIKDAPDGKPFEDMAYFILAFLLFFIWRLAVAVQSGHQGAIGVWSLFTFGTITVINIWTFFLVMVSARSRGDIGILKIHDGDLWRFTALSGVIGAWAGILLFKYKGEEKSFILKVLAATAINALWAAIYIRYYLG